MIGLAHGLQREMLCKGVETEGRVKPLKDKQCGYIQDHDFYRVPPRERRRGF